MKFIKGVPDLKILQNDQYIYLKLKVYKDLTKTKIG